MAFKFQLPTSKRALIEKASSSIFISVAIAAVLAAFSVVAINFMWDQAQYNNRVHDAKEEVRDTLIENIANAATLQASFEALNNEDNLVRGQGDRNNTAIVLDALPRKYDFPALRSSIDTLIELSGVKLTGVGGSDQESQAVLSQIDPEPIAIPFTLSVQGNYDTISKFIETFENSIRPMQLSNLTLSGTDNNLSASASMTTYYQPSVEIDITTRTVE